MISDDQFMGDMIKYADDTNIWEYLSYQVSTDSIQEVTNSVVNGSVCNKFELNPKKCKEMVINFQQNRPDFAPILIQGETTARVEKAIILGMSITQDLKWNEHVNKITKKAAKRLYLLKQLKRSGLDSNDLKCFFIASIRTILEYACQVFHYGLPKYLSDVIERIQKRALRIIFPDLSYEDALITLNMKSLWLRREDLCSKLFKLIVDDENHKLHHLLPMNVPDIYNFRSSKQFYIPKFRTNRFRNTFIMSSLLNE